MRQIHNFNGTLVIRYHLYRLDGLFDECNFIRCESILAIDLLVGYKMLAPNCWRLLMKVLTLTAPSMGEFSNTIK